MKGRLEKARLGALPFPVFSLFLLLLCRCSSVRMGIGELSAKNSVFL
jgi:hypothetical protein